MRRLPMLDRSSAVARSTADNAETVRAALFIARRYLESLGCGLDAESVRCMAEILGYRKGES
jgi:hypothetical protein